MAQKEDRTLEQYKTLAAMIAKTTEWRQKTNEFYLTINSVLISIATFLFGVFNTIAVPGIALFGVLLAVIWKQSLTSYSKLNKARFKVLQELEKKEFEYPMFKMEQDYYKQDQRKGSTSIEKWVPVLFAIAYVIILIWASAKLLGYL
jgi:hypothetical protein